MSTFKNSRQAKQNSNKCPKCKIPISWVDKCEKQGCHSIVWKPLYTFWPPAPDYLKEYDFFEQAEAYVNPPNWNKEMEQSCGTGTWICSPSISYTCVNAASNTEQVGTPRDEITERFLRIEPFQVTFAWYGARKNPLYPGTYGAPPYIRELIPTSKLPNGGKFDRPRRVFEKRIKRFTQYKGWINCVCGEPSECGC